MAVVNDDNKNDAEEAEEMGVCYEPAIEDRLLLGGEDSKSAWIYARYAMGDPVSVIAAATNKSPAQVLAIMRERPKEYEQTKQLREHFMGLRINRSLSLIDAYNLRVLEALTEGHLSASLTGDVVKKLGRIAKSLAHRHQLHEGKATEIVQSLDKVMTMDEMKDRMKEMENAGDAIPTE